MQSTSKMVYACRLHGCIW